MLKNEAEYRRAVHEITEQRARLEQQTERLKAQKLSDEQVRVAMEPQWAYHQQLAGEIEHYERIKVASLTCYAISNGSASYSSPYAFIWD